MSNPYDRYPRPKTSMRTVDSISESYQTFKSDADKKLESFKIDLVELIRDPDSKMTGNKSKYSSSMASKFKEISSGFAKGDENFIRFFEEDSEYENIRRQLNDLKQECDFTHQRLSMLQSKNSKQIRDMQILEQMSEGLDKWRKDFIKAALDLSKKMDELNKKSGKNIQKQHVQVKKEESQRLKEEAKSTRIAQAKADAKRIKETKTKKSALKTSLKPDAGKKPKPKGVRWK